MFRRSVLSYLVLPAMIAVLTVSGASARDGDRGGSKSAREIPAPGVDSKPKSGCGPTAFCLDKPKPKPACGPTALCIDKPKPKPVCGGRNVRCPYPGWEPKPKPKPVCGGPNVRCAAPGWEPKPKPLPR